MHPAIKVVVEGRRGCGFRKVGGSYLRSDGPVGSCGKLPIELSVCPCCGGGIKLSRMHQWVDADQLLSPYKDRPCASGRCETCPINKTINGGIGKALLVTVGEKYYPTVGDFVQESVKMGISRRLAGGQVPRGFKVGETWVLLAHRKAIVEAKFGETVRYKSGLFGMFLPSRIEIVVDGTESDEVIERYLERGLTPVLVKPAEEQLSLL